MVWADTPDAQRSAPTSRTIDVLAPYAARKSVLLGVIAEANGCRAIRLDTASDGHRLAVVGFAHDIEVTELLFSSLLVQMTRAMLVDESRQRSASATASWRRSFIVAFSNRVGQRLQAARRRAGVDHDQASPAGESTAAIVLADRSHRVDEETRRQFPRLRSSYVTSGGSASGARAGVRAGNQAREALDEDHRHRQVRGRFRGRSRGSRRGDGAGVNFYVAYYGTQQISFADLRAHVDAIVSSDWWADTFPSAPIEMHVERRSRTATFSAACRADGAGIVWIVDGEHWNAGVVCHELAHVASGSGHDAGFRTALLALWRRECGFPAATELSAQLNLRMTGNRPGQPFTSN